jgi:hypothetical protein
MSPISVIILILVLLLIFGGAGVGWGQWGGPGFTHYGRGGVGLGAVLLVFLLLWFFGVI